MTLDRARSLIRDIPDFPSEGILFKDITPVLGDPESFQALLDGMQARISGKGFTRVVAIESRGFLFGAALADRMRIGLAPVRKLGKLPYKTDRVEYALEYGTGTLEAHVDAISKGDKCVIVDDLLATGGTALATSKLVVKQGGVVGAYLFAVELSFLKGRARLEESGAPVEALISF